MRYVQVEKSGEFSLDGVSQPAGEFHIKEYEDDEWAGGGYSSRNNLATSISRFLNDDE